MSFCESSNTGFDVICASARGSSHVKADMAYEDCGKVLIGEFFAVFAVADGHGDQNCPRSSYGSHVACEVACEALSVFACEMRSTLLNESDPQHGVWEQKLFDERQQESIVRQLVTSIVGNWTDAVGLHFEANPLTEEERKQCSGYIEKYDKGERIEHVYGTTLIAGLLTDSYLLLLQQGDGKCVLFEGDGNVIEPVPWDEKCFANVTTSLCDEDAINRCRYSIWDVANSPIAACFIGTDGVDDSFFSAEQMHSFYRELLCNCVLCTNAEGMADLESRLFDLSKQGSGDDVTIAGVVAPNSFLESIAERLKRDIVAVDMTGEMAQLDDRLRSMQGKLEYLHAELGKAESAEKAASEELHAAWEEYKDYTEDADASNETVVEKLFSWRFRKRIETMLQSELANSEKRLNQRRDDLRLATQHREAVQLELEEYLHKHEVYENRKRELEGLLSSSLVETFSENENANEVDSCLEVTSDDVDSVEELFGTSGIPCAAQNGQNCDINEESENDLVGKTAPGNVCEING